MKVVISGGGTGGHVFPSLAIADEITKRDPANKVLFIGTSRGLESEIVPSRGYRFEAVGGAGVAGGGFSGALRGVFHSALGIVKSIFILLKFSPDAAVGMGGYASFSAIVAARLIGVPAAICEQNSVAGLANRLLGKIVQRVFLSFAPRCSRREPFARSKVRVVGNPVRGEMVAAAKNLPSSKRFPQSGTCTIFIIGGSRGAHSLNRSVPGALGLLKDRTGTDIRAIHQSGHSNISGVQNAYRSAGVKNALVFDFSPEISKFYSESDLVISRAGAGAVCEIALFSKPSILVPYPFAAHGHQRANAEMMEKAGASVVIDEENLSQKAIAETLQRLLNWNILERMSAAAAGFAVPDAARRIADEIEDLAKG